MTGETQYDAVFRTLELDERARALAMGKAPMPSPTLYPPFPAAGGPPALIPIWVAPTGLTYSGYWLHFFVPRRLTLVVCAGEGGFGAVENACTPDQLFAHACIRELSVMGGPTDDIERFATASGLDLAALDRVSAEVGDDPRALAVYEPFATAPPLSMVPDALERYAGDFPRPGTSPSADELRRSCTLEYAEADRRQLARRQDAPPWFSRADLPVLFHELLAAGDHAGAWLTLNSSGWSTARAKAALEALATAAGDPRLSTLAAAWCAQPHAAMPAY